MSHPDSPYSNASFQYVGSELEVFSHAINWKTYLASQIRPFLRGKVLEVGAGIGTTTTALASGNEESWTCLEPDLALANTLKANLNKGNLPSSMNFQIIAGDLTKLPPENTFDCILYIDVLEHISADRTELRLAASHLTPGGHLVVLSPAHQWLFSPFDEAIGHFRRYSRNSLRDTGPENLKLVTLKYLDSVGLLASMANRFFLRTSAPSTSQIRVWDRLMVPISRLVDPLTFYRLGKSVLAVWCYKIPT
jgi:ubiquinone/menaquinone biosynthesis C-methylase UbiE